MKHVFCANCNKDITDLYNPMPEDGLCTACYIKIYHADIKELTPSDAAYLRSAYFRSLAKARTKDKEVREEYSRRLDFVYSGVAICITVIVMLILYFYLY